MSVPAGLGSRQIHGAEEAKPKYSTMNPRLFTSVGGNAGAWTVIQGEADDDESEPSDFSTAFDDMVAELIASCAARPDNSGPECARRTTRDERLTANQWVA